MSRAYLTAIRAGRKAVDSYDLDEPTNKDVKQWGQKDYFFDRISMNIGSLFRLKRWSAALPAAAAAAGSLDGTDSSVGLPERSKSLLYSSSVMAS
ncbi:MAG: hypothetical protein AAB466_10465 [Verrucomicrobiota bacterium]